MYKPPVTAAPAGGGAAGGAAGGSATQETQGGYSSSVGVVQVRECRGGQRVQPSLCEN